MIKSLLVFVFTVVFAGAVHARRLVVLTSTASDFVEELGLSGEVVGRADNVETPALQQAAKVGRSDGVNLEAVLALHPDAVLGSPQYHAALGSALAGAKVKLELIGIRKWDDVPSELRRIAADLGAAKADELAARLTARMRAVETPPAGSRPKVVVIVNAEPLLAATAGSYSADLIRLAGGDAGGIPDAPGQFRGFTQLSDEKLLELNPDIILLSRWRSVAQLDAALAGRPFWKELQAVKAGAVKQIEADRLYTVPGPRGIATVNELKNLFHTLGAK